MPMKDPEHFGSENDGTASTEYCAYCYSNGAFTADVSMEEMIQICADMDFPMLDENGRIMGRDQKAAIMRQSFSTLARWK